MDNALGNVVCSGCAVLEMQTVKSSPFPLPPLQSMVLMQGCGSSSNAVQAPHIERLFESSKACYPGQAQ